MRFFARLNPLPAINDLRGFLAQRQPYELWFGILAILLTSVVIFAFFVDSRVAVPYRSNITYVESWPLSRTDKEIIAQQKIDQAKKEKREAEIRAAQLKRQAEFKRLDERLKAYGL